MNLLVDVLSEGELDPEPHNATTLVAEDCIGEAVHLHYRNVRLEMSIDDFSTFVENLESATEELEQWE